MLLAVMPYGRLSFYIDNDDVLVLDPETLEVYWTTMSHSRHEISSMSYAEHRGTFSYTVFSLYDIFGSEQMLHFALQHIDYNENAFLLDSSVRVIVRHNPAYDGNRNIYVNGVAVCECGTMEVSYIFRFRDYYILRFRLSDFNMKPVWWASAAVDKSGKVADTWTRGKCNTALSLQVDTLLGY